jgi:hypothetical protein
MNPKFFILSINYNRQEVTHNYWHWLLIVSKLKSLVSNFVKCFNLNIAKFFSFLFIIKSRIESKSLAYYSNVSSLSNLVAFILPSLCEGLFEMYICNEDFLLELDWILMITNFHHKIRKIYRGSRWENKMKTKKLYLLLFKLVVTCKYGLYLDLLFR